MSVPSFIYSEHFKIQISYYGLKDLASVFFSKLCSLLLFQIHWPLSKLHHISFSDLCLLFPQNGMFYQQMFSKFDF